MMKVVLKIETCQLFWDTFFYKMGQLFRDGGSTNKKNDIVVPLKKTVFSKEKKYMFQKYTVKT
jgi:hypothetical protein